MNTLTEIRNIRTDTSTMPRAKLHDRIAMRAGLAMIRWAQRNDTRPVRAARLDPDSGTIAAIAEHRQIVEAKHRISLTG